MKIELKKLVIQYSSYSPLVDSVDLTIKNSDFLFIKGESGCGKTSLLKVISKLHEPASGKIIVDGSPIDTLDIPKYRRKVFYLHQTPVMLKGSVYENLLFPFDLKSSNGLDRPGTEELRNLMDMFLLNTINLNDNVSGLSLGEKQRLAIIRAYLIKPVFLLCDEPTSALDKKSKVAVEKFLEQINLNENIGIVVVSHQKYSYTKDHIKFYALSANGLELL